MTGDEDLKAENARLRAENVRLIADRDQWNEDLLRIARAVVAGEPLDQPPRPARPGPSLSETLAAIDKMKKIEADHADLVFVVERISDGAVAKIRELVDILEFFLVATDPLLDATSFDAYDPVAHHAVSKRAREVVADIRAAGAGVTKTGWSAELPVKPGWYFMRYTRPGFDRAIVFCNQVVTGPDGATLHVCDDRNGPTPLDKYAAYEWAAVSPPP